MTPIFDDLVAARTPLGAVPVSPLWRPHACDVCGRGIAVDGALCDLCRLVGGDDDD